MHRSIEYVPNMYSLRFRLREWFARQYRRAPVPHQQFTRRPSATALKNPLPWQAKSLLMLLGVFAVVIGMVAVGVAGLMFWAIVSR
jgi:hypothetical protein